MIDHQNPYVISILAMINTTAGILGNRVSFMQDAVSHCKSSSLEYPQMEILYEVLIKVM